MSCFSRCSWCGGPFNGGNCRHCTNVSFRDEPIYDPNPNSYNQTPDISNPPSQPLTSSFNQFHCFHCKDPLKDGVRCQRCTCVRYGHYLGDGFCSFCNSEAGNSFVNDSNPNSFNDPPNFSDYPPQPQYETYLYELCGNDSHYGYDCPPRFPLIKDYRNEKIDIRFRRECENMIDELKGKFNGMSIEINKKKQLQQLEQAAKLSTYTTEPSRIHDVNPLFDEVLEDIKCKDSYDSNFDESTFLVTPLSDSNEDNFFSPGDDIEFLIHRDASTPTISVVSILEGFTDEPILEENDDLFDLESNANDWKKIFYNAPIDDLIFDPGGAIDEIDTFLDIDISMDIEDGYHDSEGDILYLESLLSNDTILSLPPKVFLDHDSRILSDINDLKIMVKVFDPGIHDKKINPTYVSLSFEDHHYLSFTYVIRIFLPYFTYPVVSSLPLSSGSEDIIFDPGISAFHFYSLNPVVTDIRERTKNEAKRTKPGTRLE
ncbi:hypothetical protein Tco_1483461 [Tanacetum coccineum]